MRAKRDYAMLALLFGCGFRRSELVGLELDEIQVRQGHWAVVQSATQDSYPHQNEPIRSRSEKVIARTAFDDALGRELHEVIQEAKRMVSQIQQSSSLWDLEHYLTQRRKEIDRKYDYRYSQLTQVFGRLLYEKRLVRKSCAVYARTS
jgi:integrase